MGFIDRLLGREPGETKSTLSLTNMGVQRLSPIPSTAPADLLKAYRGNPMVHACVRIKSQSATDPRLIVQERTSDDEWEEVAGHPLRRLIMRPNRFMDESMLIRYAQKSIDTMGLH